MNKNMKYVLAGNHMQFYNYLKETNQSLTSCRFISRREQIQGLHNIKVIRYGTWWENPLNTDPLLKIVEEKHD